MEKINKIRFFLDIGWDGFSYLIPVDSRANWIAYMKVSNVVNPPKLPSFAIQVDDLTTISFESPLIAKESYSI